MRPWNIEEDKPAEISGRQQTLRVAVQRKLNRALAETYLWASPKLPIDESTETTMHVEAAQVAGGWLQVALKERDGCREAGEVSTCRVARASCQCHSRHPTRRTLCASLVF